MADLIPQLESQTAVLSSPPQMLRTPAARSLMQQGQEAVPALLQALREHKAVISVMALLAQITGENPVAPQERGHVDNMIRAWIRWGEQQGILKWDEAAHPRGKTSDASTPGSFAPAAGGAKEKKKPSIFGNMKRKGKGPDAQPTKDIDKLYAMSKEAYPEFENDVRNTAFATNGEIVWSPKTADGDRLKARARVIEKTNSDYDGDVSQVKDIIRGTVLYDTVKEARLGAASFIADHEDDIVRVKDRYAESSGGYRDMMINYRTKNGVIAEVQFNSRQMMLAKSGSGGGGHALFKEMRSLPRTNLNLLKVRSLKERSSRLYATAYERDGDGHWSSS